MPRPEAVDRLAAAPRRAAAGGRALRVGALAAVCALVAYGATLRDYGPVSDEGNYFVSSRYIATWVRDAVRDLASGEAGRALTDRTLDASWRWNIERVPHPPFSRELSALSVTLFERHLDIVSAFRALDVLLAALLVGGIAAWGTLRTGALGGLLAGAGFLVLPRVFAHAHFADTDFVLTALVFFTFFCAAEARRAPLAKAGALWGLALATKFSAALVPFALVPWLALFRRRALRQLPLFAIVAAFVFVAVDPVAWVHPVQTAADYLRMGLARREMDLTQLPTVYFGRLYIYRPSWHYPLVMLTLTTPLGLLLLAATGAAAGVARPAWRATTVLALLVPVVFLGALELPSAPMHDDVRLFLPIFPFLALLAGLGGAWLVRKASAPSSAPSEAVPESLDSAAPAPGGAGARRTAGAGPIAQGLGDVAAGAWRLAAVAAVALALGGAAVTTVRMHPFQGSYYNALAGGVAGAERRGLEVTGMKEVLSRDLYRDLVRLLPPDASLEGGPFLYEDLELAQALGWLGPGISVRPDQPADYVLLVNRAGWLRAGDRALLHFAKPAYAVSVDGVPLVALYRLR